MRGFENSVPNIAFLILRGKEVSDNFDLENKNVPLKHENKTLYFYF
jgi:hypothetical protein